MLVIACALLALAPSSATAAFLTFDEFDVGSLITDDYSSEGVLFSGDFGEVPEIAWDEANPTSPVLRGGEDFYEPLHAQFVYPGTSTAATVSDLSVDVGYINDPYSTQLVLQTTTGPIVLPADEYGINYMSSSANNITGFDLEAVGAEGAGFAIDNLSFTPGLPPAPEPAPTPPQPSRASRCYDYVIYDSRGSGEEKNEVSKPGRDFVRGFRERLNDLNAGKRFSAVANLYPAVGVLSWSPLQTLNGFGAFLHSATIGAYKDSVDEGVKKLGDMIERQVDSFCGKRKTKIILLGYSQGAQVTGNVYADLSAKERKQVAAVVLWGDPLYNHRDRDADREDRPLDGSLGTRGQFPAGRKVFSHCNTHDPICQWRLPASQLVSHQLKEHSLYWKTEQAANHGREVATFLAKHR
ncbi:MAG TPA: cutinase family protein [Solirubrobacterales bacterium]|nr:cutinase family protein [Solirubrobacterales bacterium]